MAFSISELRSNIEIVRPNLFKAEVSFPIGIFSTFERMGLAKTLEFRCESVELPGRTVATYDDQSSGSTKKIAYDITYSDINLTIIASEDMNERYLFEKWIDNIIMPSNYTSGAGGLVKYYNTYASGAVRIRQLNDAGSIVYESTLYDAFPTQISSMNLNWAEFDTYQRFTVTMTYRYHESTSYL